MTQPNPSATGDEQQERIKRGARVTLDSRKRFPGTVAQASEERVLVEFPGTENLGQQMTDSNANAALLVFRVGHRDGPPDVAVKVFLNTPDAGPTTPTTTGFAGAVAFFDHEHAHGGGQGNAPFRFPITAAAQQVGGGAAITATFVPVPYPDRTSTPQVLDINAAAIQLVRSTVEPR